MFLPRYTNLVTYLPGRLTTESPGVMAVAIRHAGHLAP